MATRADIRTLARIHADQDSSDFPTDTQYNLLIDAAGKRVWYDLMKAGWPVNFATTTLTGAGTNTIALSAGSPAPTLPIMGIHGAYFVQANERFSLKRINEGDRAQLLSTIGVTGFAEYYDVRVDATSGFIIELLPKASGGSYQIDYITGFPGFSGDSAVWPGPDRSDELVAMAAAIPAIKKEGPARQQDAVSKKDEYKDLLQEVTDMVSWLNLRDPAMIRDVTSRKTRYAFDYNVAGPDMGFY